LQQNQEDEDNAVQKQDHGQKSKQKSHNESILYHRGWKMHGISLARARLLTDFG
jgi:hypothetical protein